MDTVEVHKFIEGPFEVGDGTCYNLCLALFPDGDWYEVELYYPDFNSAYDVSINLNRNPNPMEVSEECLISNLN
jgi:hypothetical protein